MSTCSIRFLGTSDGLPSAERNHASILIRLGERRYLFDCGEPVSHTLKRHGVPFEAVDRLLISHLHADHCGGFLMLMQSCWLENRRKPLPVHMPAEGIEPFRTLLRTTYLFDRLLPFHIRMQALEAGRPIRDGTLRVIPYPTTHLQRLKREFGRRCKAPFQSFCFEVGVEKGTRIGYSADLGAPADLAPLVNGPLDLLIVELAHFSDINLFEYLRDKPIRKIVLTHLGREYWGNAEVAKRARRYFARDRLIIARDGLELKF